MKNKNHGSMNISEHEKTYEGFVKFTTRCVIGMVILLAFLGVFVL